MSRTIITFIAGWIACVIGWEISPIYGNITAAIFIVILILYYDKP